jgi:pilus biogenesis lipoprotein CpaD
MRTLARHIAPVVLGLLAAACNGDTPAQQTIIDNDYQLKHPIVVEPATATMQLQSAAGHAVTDDDRRRLHDFAGVFIRRGSGSVEISVGGRGSDDAEARAYAQDIAQRLLGEGLKTSELRLQLVIGDPATTPGRAALRFATAAVNLPPCRDWSESASNAPFADFGCSVQRNLGAMVADPRDLERARDSGTAHSDKGDVAIDKMNRGEATWSVPLPLSATTKSSGGS